MSAWDGFYWGFNVGIWVAILVVNITHRLNLKSPAGPVQPTDTNAAPVDQRRTE